MIKEEKIDIIITTNAAGELAAWVKPVVIAIKKRLLHSRLIIVLTPSQFITGYEYDYAKNLKGVDLIITSKDFRKILLRGKFPYIKADKGIILSLGGDLIYPVLLKWRTRYPIFAYIEKRKQWARYIEAFFDRDNLGDLMVDSIKEKGLEIVKKHYDKSFTIALLPGSRAYHIKHMIPLLEKTADILADKYTNINFVWKLSPFIEENAIQEYSYNKKISIKKDFNNIDLAITIPGTNTAQLAILGIPMLVVMPYNWPEDIPIEGAGELLSKIPLIGKLIKKALFNILAPNIKYLALPNILANENIVPELKGKLTAKDIAIATEKILLDYNLRCSLQQKLPQIMGPKGAAEKLVSEIINI